MRQRPFYEAAVRQVAFRHGKMTFLTGPRQVGKTTLARSLGSGYGRSSYYSWDDPAFRRQWIKDPKQLIETSVGPKELLILDELHKAPRWKTHLKGLYDLRGEFADILVTGSARLNIFRRGGDSLLGRYFLFHLHPFTIGEMTQESPPGPDGEPSLLDHPLASHGDVFNRLLSFGGFPEPYEKAETDFHRLWQRTRTERLIREDLRDLTRAHDVAMIETMTALLPERVGSPFSLQSLVEDLGVAYATAQRWLRWLEMLFYVYTVPPYNRRLARSIRKQPKIYLWDWSEVTDPGARLENLVAGHLLKACHAWTDTGKGRFDLYYLRDKERREVDFLITRDEKPWWMVECKSSDTSFSPALGYFSKFLKPQLTLQLVNRPHQHKKVGPGSYLISVDKFLGLLP